LASHSAFDRGTSACVTLERLEAYEEEKNPCEEEKNSCTTQAYPCHSAASFFRGFKISASGDCGGERRQS
jgi:hypothetical protein